MYLSACLSNFSFSISVRNQLTFQWNVIIRCILVIETVPKCYSLFCWAFPKWWPCSVLRLYQQSREIVQDGCSSFIVVLFPCSSEIIISWLTIINHPSLKPSSYKIFSYPLITNALVWTERWNFLLSFPLSPPHPINIIIYTFSLRQYLSY